MKLFGRILANILGYAAFLVLAMFAEAAIYICSPLSEETNTVFSLVITLTTLYAFAFRRTWRSRFLCVLPVHLLFFGWYLSMSPKMEANWAREVAVLPDMEIQGDTLSVKNIRYFHYRSETDFDPAYYDKKFDLSRIKSVDLFLSYWGPRAIAHTIMSFGFENGDQLAISIETRKEAGETYSAVQGFFKKFELIYVVADERDLVGLRVNHRGEDVYLYRLLLTAGQARDLLLDYAKTIQRLETKPAFYNALLTNCTTSILPHIKAVKELSFHWSLIANGYIDLWRYERGAWGFAIPFEEFRRRSLINDKVRKYTDAEDFSVRIREGLPSFTPPSDSKEP